MDKNSIGGVNFQRKMRRGLRRMKKNVGRMRRIAGYGVKNAGIKQVGGLVQGIKF